MLYPYIMNQNIEEWQNRFEVYMANHPTDDGSHDVSHFRRVWNVANKLSSDQDDKLVILAACYFHDIVNYPKNHPKRSLSSREAGLKAKDILKEMNFPSEKLDHVKHCIEAHSFSANIETKTREAEVVQDSDRMEALGAIGLSRTFYVAGQMGSKIFSNEDPFAETRELDEGKFAIDHFQTKLLKLPMTMKTEEGKEEALRRAKILEDFLKNLKNEIL